MTHSLSRSFRERVFAVVRQIPRGQVRTYAQIARAVGSPRAFRAVGAALATNTDPVDVPCHRVIRSDGTIGGYRWGTVRKQARLRKEGISIRAGKIRL